MITKTAEEIAKMAFHDILAEYPAAAMFINSCSLSAGMMGVTGEPAVVAFAIGIGTSLAANDVLNPEDMTGFDGYTPKLIAIMWAAYTAAYIEVKAIHESEMKRRGGKVERPQ